MVEDGRRGQIEEYLYRRPPRMIKLSDILQEIGDSSTKAAPYSKTSETKNNEETKTSYEFKIGEDTYIVTLYIGDLDLSLPSNKAKQKGNTGMHVVFGLKTSRYSGGSGDTTSTNRGVQYQVMATVTKIIKDYIDKHPELTQITYEPSKRSASDRGRIQLYKAYVQKALPNWQYREDSHGFSTSVTLDKSKPEKQSLLKRIFK